MMVVGVEPVLDDDGTRSTYRGETNATVKLHTGPLQ